MVLHYGWSIYCETAARFWRVIRFVKHSYPREVEDAIATHPGVAMSAVLGIPDEKWGEAVCAYVVTKPGSTVSAADIIATVKGLKGSVLAPKEIRFVEKLPLTAVGKIDKKPLRDAAWANSERRVN
jgi:fatty-acyl-CoA synthase